MYIKLVNAKLYRRKDAVDINVASILAAPNCNMRAGYNSGTPSGY